MRSSSTSMEMKMVTNKKYGIWNSVHRYMLILVFLYSLRLDVLFRMESSIRQKSRPNFRPEGSVGRRDDVHIVRTLTAELTNRLNCSHD